MRVQGRSCWQSMPGAKRRNRLAQPVRAGLGCLFAQKPAKRATHKQMPKHRPQPAAILTISDGVSKKRRQDLSGPALKEVLKANGYAVITIKVVPDEKSKISAALKQLAKKARLVVSTGGTGISKRDVTPEATRAVIQKEVPGVVEWIRASGALQNPRAALSRAVCGIRDKSVILNLPGNPRGAAESLLAVIHLLPH